MRASIRSALFSFVGLFAFLLLAGCGGGSGGGGGGGSGPSGTAAPTISSQPQSTGVDLGQSLTLSVTATGSAPLSYQWQLNGSPIQGATSAAYSVAAAAASSAGSYTVTVSNSLGSVTSTAAAVTVNTPSAQSFSPSSGLPNMTIQMTGTALRGVTSATVGGTTANVSVVSSSQVNVTVPAGATSGAIQLSGSGFSLPFTGTFTVLPEPAPSAATTKETAVLGGKFVIYGTHLGEVKTWSLGGTALQEVSTSDTMVVLQAPSSATSGTLQMTDTAGNVITTTLSLTTFDPSTVSVSGFSPASVAEGDTLTLTGQGLDNVGEVLFYDSTDLQYNSSSNSFNFPSGAQPTLVAAPATQTATSLTVVVPRLAQGGTVEVADSAGTPLGHTSSSSLVQVVKRVVVDWVRTEPQSGHLNIFINGDQLNQVTSASVGGAAASIVGQTLTSLELSVPSAANGAPIVLTAANQSPVNAGVTATIAAGLALNSIEFAQLRSQQSTDAYLRLTQGLPTLVREFVTADTAQHATATLTATNGSSTLGTVTMTPPTSLPLNASVYGSSALGTASDPEYSANSAFTAQLPASWVQPGLTVAVTVNPDPAVAPGAAPVSIQASPPVSATAGIDVVVVPLVINGVAPTVPPVQEIEQTLADAYAYPLADIHVTLHGNVTVDASTATGINSVSDLANVLNFVETLRTTEASTAVYYGMYSSSSAVLNPTASFVGLAHRPYLSTPPSTWQTSAVGYDSTAYGNRDYTPFGFYTADWQQVIVHELGHVHTLPHTGCFNSGSPPAGIDFGFPYDATGGGNGTVGFQPLYSYFSGGLAAPYFPTLQNYRLTDVMGYCLYGNSLFSSYSAYFTSLFDDAYNQAFSASSGPARAKDAARSTASAPNAASATTNGYLTLSGMITNGRVEFAPAQASSAAPLSREPAVTPSTWALRVNTATNGIIEMPVYPSILDDAGPGVRSFSITLPNPGAISSVQLLERGTPLPDTTPAARIAHLKRGARTQPTRSTQQAGLLTLSWDSAAEPFLTVTQVATDGTRHVLAQRLTGGSAVIDVSAVPTGAHLEISRSSAYGASLSTVTLH